MFRNETRLSPVHSYEFTVVDIYEPGHKETVKKKFLTLLTQLEKDLSLRPLSKKIIEIDHSTQIKTVKEKECWVLVNNYPREESFYDVAGSKGRTKKFELFYKNDEHVIEIVACGELGKNVNPLHYIKNDAVVKRPVLHKGFVGFGIGIERLLLLYAGRK